MAEPKIVERFCEIINLSKGTHLWCACGESKNQPLCDGSHKGTEFSPVSFEAPGDRSLKLCLCKHTKSPPYCDGSHGTL